jgi:hypothetical protein
MRSSRLRSGATAFAVVLICGSALTTAAFAAGFTYSEDFTKFGQTANFACGGKGACGAVSTVNSFTFLGKQYPQVYGNPNKLTPNYNAGTNTDMTDAQKFGFDGWQVGANPMRMGYYPRPGGAESDFLQTKKDWINDYAPGTTKFSSWWAGSPDNNRKPTINDLAQEIKNKEDVEFFVDSMDAQNPFFHVMTLTEVSCDMNNACSVRYQDPNQPAVNQASTPITVNNGMLMFTGVPGSGFAKPVTITAAFSESPINVPEPSTIVILATVGIGLVFRCRQRQA